MIQKNANQAASRAPYDSTACASARAGASRHVEGPDPVKRPVASSAALIGAYLVLSHGRAPQARPEDERDDAS